MTSTRVQYGRVYRFALWCLGTFACFSGIFTNFLENVRILGRLQMASFESEATRN